MTHTTRLVKLERINSGQWTLVFRCCNDPATDYPVSVADSIMGDSARKPAKLAEYSQLAAQRHDEQVKAEAGILESAGVTQDHEIP